MTEKQVRDIVKKEIRSQLINMPSKADVNKIAKDEANKSAKKVSDETLTKKEVKDMIRDSLLAYHKFMWEKKGIWMNQI